MRHDVQDESIKEAVYLQGLPLVQSNLAGQFCPFLAQVSSLQTMTLTLRLEPICGRATSTFWSLGPCW